MERQCRCTGLITQCIRYPIILDAFNNTICTYYGQSNEIGIYTSDKPYKSQTDYTPETFFTLVKSSTIINVASTTDIPLTLNLRPPRGGRKFHVTSMPLHWAYIPVHTVDNIDDPEKIVFNHLLYKTIDGSPTINTICKLEREFRSAIQTRADTLKYLKQFEPVSIIKWYYRTSYYQKLCRKHCRHLIIDILAETINNLNSSAEPTLTKHESLV